MSPSPADAPRDSAAPLDSTAPRALPRWRQPSLWLALLASMALAGLVGGRYVRRVAPGPLSAVHGRHDELNGSWDCSSCHGGFGESMAQACLECHGEIAQQMERKAGLHGALEAGLAEACARCHGEHHGEAFVPVNPRSFALAGFADLQQFDHAKVGYALAGGHADLACAKCHSNADSGELPRGGWRYLGQHQDCATCHADPHQGRMAPACSDCHTDRDWNESFLFAHDEFLPLIGGHGEQRCRDCHAADSPHALERLGHGPRATRAADRTATRPAARRCSDCHASPHAKEFTAHAARLADTTPEQGCVTCHAADRASFRDPRATVTPEQHAAASLQLAAPHSELDCARCHDPAGADYAARYPGRGARDCAACHADPHGGQFDGSKQAPLGCVSCHDFRFFAPHTFTVGRHARTALPLAGAHREADCASCHEASRELKEAPATAHSASTVPRRFHGTEARCEECHADPHDGLFDARYRTPPPAAGSCARCHGTTAFDQLVAPFDHGRATGFALRGAHLQADCASCHAPLPAPDAKGRTFARAQERFSGDGTRAASGAVPARLATDRCATCHADPHAGAFADFAPADGARARGCVDCHDEVSFRAASASFDHAAATGFALDGAHGTAGCSDCHAPLPARDARGRTSAPALGNACGDCHDDPHAGQFVRDGENRCTPCHSPTADFSALFFQHNLHSTFRLDETHRAAACSACHPVFLHEEREVVRYRPLPSDCADCHGAPQEPLRRRRGRSG